MKEKAQAPRRNIVKWAAISVWAIFALLIAAAVLGKKQRLASAPDWVRSMRASCELYSDESNPMAKRALVDDAISLLSAAQVQLQDGKITEVGENGNGTARLEIEYAGATLLAPSISKGDPIYGVVASLHDGDCATFSAAGFRPSSILERNKICDLDYLIAITEIRPCR